MIAILLQSRQNAEETREYVEVGSGTDVSLVGWKTIKYQRQLQLITPGNLQIVPSLQSSCDSTATIFQRRRLDATLRNSTENKWFGRTVNFGNRHLHSGLHWIQTGE